MDLYQIRYFLTIIEVNSFTKAAQKHFISQPSLSAGIKKLEQELAVTLFERGGGTRQVILTPAGLMFQKRAKAILAEYQSARQDLKDLEAQPTIRLATLHSLRVTSIAKMVREFHQRYPQVSISICNGYLHELQSWLEEGTVDLVITRLQDSDNSQTSQLLFHQALALAVPQDHLFAGAKSVCLEDLSGHPYIERLNCEFWRVYSDIFRAKGIDFKKVHSANNEEWVIALVQAGMGMSIMPVWTDVEQIKYIPITDLSLSRLVGLRWRVPKCQGIVKEFIEFAVNCDWQVSN